MLRTRILAGTMAGLVMSAVFASVLCVVNVSETFIESLRVRPGEPAPVTLRIAFGAFEEQPESLRRVHSEVFVARGTVVRDPSTAAHVERFESQRRPVQLGVVLGL